MEGEMPDVTEKAAKQAGDRSGLKAPADESQVRGPRPVLDNKWGSALAKGQSSIGVGGKK